jgi:uncharacterized protein
MPVQPTYPGVYVQEVPSGVRTIVGVSTSVTAFVGTAKRGPINKPVTIYNYADFEKRFGGLSSDSEMSYAVRSFFLNGGSQAVIVRLARSATNAAKMMTNEPGTTNVLDVTALDAGFNGNYIDVSSDFNTLTPNATFNFTVRYRSIDNPIDNRTEYYPNVSNNSFHPRYIANLVNGASELVSVAQNASAVAFAFGAGTATGPYVLAANVLAYASNVTPTRNQFMIAVNGGDPMPVVLPATYVDLATLAIAINTITNPLGCTCSNDILSLPGSHRLVFTSNLPGQNSRIEITTGLVNDAAVALQLGAAYGGTQVDAAAIIRPGTTPLPAVLTGTAATIGIANTGTLTVSLNGNIAQTITYTAFAVAGATNAARGPVMAAKIQADVRALRVGIEAYDKFTCTFNGTAFVMSTGTRGAGSSISISQVGLVFGLAAPATNTLPIDTYLTGGLEFPFTDALAYGVYIGNRALRQGIYALESVDIFNILCLPGIPNTAAERAGILADANAYCKERRAFFVIDCARLDDTPAEMSTAIVGTSLPKSDNAAVYFPWIKIPDPLNGGQPRISAPCGMIAGIYARTDSSRGIWKAPAGTEATLNGTVGLDYTLTDAENGSLNPLGANCLRTFPVYGSVVWGARTLRGNDQMASEYKYVPVRRLAYFIEESLYRGLKWTVFEPNDEPLWAQIRLNAGAFMQNLFRQGAFQGQKRDDAYFVKCDKETTTQNDINLGIVNIWIGFAPLKPAEFVVLYIQQIAGQIQV